MAKEIYHPVLSFHSKSCAGCTVDRAKHGKPVAVKPVVILATVTKCPDGTAELQREASRSFFPSSAQRAGYLPSPKPVKRDASDIEHDAERRMELFGAARASGMSVSDALDECNGW